MCCWRGIARFPTILNTNPSVFPVPYQTYKQANSGQRRASFFTEILPFRWPEVGGAGCASGSGCVGLLGQGRLRPSAMRPPHPGRGAPIPPFLLSGNQGFHPTPLSLLSTFLYLSSSGGPGRKAGSWACAVWVSGDMGQEHRKRSHLSPAFPSRAPQTLTRSGPQFPRYVVMTHNSQQ